MYYFLALNTMLCIVGCIKQNVSLSAEMEWSQQKNLVYLLSHLTAVFMTCFQDQNLMLTILLSEVVTILEVQYPKDKVGYSL